MYMANQKRRTEWVSATELSGVGGQPADWPACSSAGRPDVSGSISLSGNTPNYRCSAISKFSPGGDWPRKIVWTWNAAAEPLIFTRNKILNFSAGKNDVLLLTREIFNFISV